MPKAQLSDAQRAALISVRARPAVNADYHGCRISTLYRLRDLGLIRRIDPPMTQRWSHPRLRFRWEITPAGLEHLYGQL